MVMLSPGYAARVMPYPGRYLGMFSAIVCARANGCPALEPCGLIVAWHPEVLNEAEHPNLAASMLIRFASLLR
jgi:hypothetical protein